MPAIGEARHHVTLDSPGPPVPDGEGGWVDSWVPLDPPDWYCAIQTPTVRDLETIGAGTVIAQAPRLLAGHYHAGITTQSRVRFEDRVLSVVAVVNVDERGITTKLLCTEVVP